MAIIYFKCNTCGNMFLSSPGIGDKVLICGEGCGGTLYEIEPEEAQKEVERRYVESERRNYS